MALALAVGLGVPLAALAAPLPPHDSEAQRVLAKASPAVRALDARVRERSDNGGRPFAILDKAQARLYVYDPNGRLQGAAPVLLGLARGDDSVPGIGERPIAKVRPFERTTPAGRFDAKPGRNANGEDVVWVDYDAAVSMHRMRAIDPTEHRPQRLATPSPADNRISFGCINLPPAFFDHVLRPLFTRGGQPGGVVYVLPETRPLQAQFAALFETPRAGSGAAAIDARSAARLQLARRS
ncbi:L,D-transpeptidase [Aquabacterium humicola]|uniref:L,D-transpeptidase n=1 Tax=Aquabacterium humicola TaxID=3237377 RepID=UPI002542E9D6|nr:L,D-transpeptidase [Rubrivivax pictus]